MFCQICLFGVFFLYIYFLLSFVSSSALSCVVVPYSQLQNLISSKGKKVKEQQTTTTASYIAFFNRYIDVFHSGWRASTIYTLSV